jgi:hypothetical protein
MGIERGCEKGAHGNGPPAANQTFKRRQAPFIAT